ncbi:MAG: Asp-tRNA(Asn)/Glu-tRNA(Gln) amidotransferase subunit GatB [Candidatus Saccharibacteria bacterium]|nr:Asp-tRNA(Asn)/Glu-tRNA(Gln) amidotransferase subunit GatB [Candidatus Saccharibacteria bacterium]
MVSDETLGKYQMTVGIECHVQLATATKLFSGADNDERGKSPNSVVSPIDFGLPGMLPVLNRGAVDLAIKAGKALNSPIAHVSRFDRKHYFYPDLPKGYQTTQMYQPIIGPGVINIPMDSGESFNVRINHAHMEEDAGKLTHHGGFSLVDLNRAGTPLIEIVTEPDIHSSVQAKAFVVELYRLMTYAGVTRGDLYHGNMRFDVNTSAAPKGSNELGTRSEVKNLNSFRSVERAIEFEFRRQVELLEKGENIVQETRGWDEAKQRTTSQRNKEDSQDYRYMPDADIPPIILSDEEINRIQATVPPLPPFYRESWKVLNLDSTVTNALIADQPTAQLIQRILEKSGTASAARRVAIWQLMAVEGQTDDSGIVQNTGIHATDDYLIELSNMVEKNELSSTAAKEIFYEMNRRPDIAPRDIAAEKNLIQVSDESEIIKVVDSVLNDPSFAKAVADLEAGNEKVIGFLVGQVMKKSQGKANPALAQKLIKERLKI